MITRLIAQIVCLASAVFVADLPATAAETKISDAASMKFAHELGTTLPPKGWVRFCQRNPADCKGDRGKRIRVKLDAERWRELTGINTYVNHTIEPATDLEIYNVEEMWALPQSRGDCEDYVLLKRQHLLTLGWPRETLLITVVLDKNNAGHAVLTIMTDHGELVLDNQHPKILPWTATRYQFVKRQAQVDPQKWVALDPIAAGVRRQTSSGRQMGEHH